MLIADTANPILKVNTVLRTLLLYNGDIRDKGVMAIAQALSGSHVSVLQTLGFGNNGIGERAQSLGSMPEGETCQFNCFVLGNNQKLAMKVCCN